MGWLFGPTLFSVIVALIVVRIFDYIKDGIFNGPTGDVVNTARAGVFVGTWTAVTAKLGMRGFTARVRQLRHGNADALSRISALTKGERRK